jgi:serine/threonine protein kinase
MKLVNVDAAGNKRGVFSLVFSADDVVEGKRVALKFYDPDPALTNNVYRIQAFQREHEILQSLLNVNRCLQLASALGTYNLPISANGAAIALPCAYFAVDWLDRQIDQHFLDQLAFDGLVKLKLLGSIILAVEALHRNNVFHRDLKPDNLRQITKGETEQVVAIDLGTAARFDSMQLASNYGSSVGAPAYASPEALCGFAGDRNLASFTDVYAVGCMLYELFNPDYYFKALTTLNPTYWPRIAALGFQANQKRTEAERRAVFHAEIGKLVLGVTPVDINRAGSSAPAEIAPMLNDLLHALTHPNFMARCTLPYARTRLQSCIVAITNSRLAKRSQDRLKQERARRRQNQIDKEARLKAALQARAKSC